CAVADHHEDLAVCGAAVPLVVGQVRGMRALGRHRAVAFRIGAVAETAVLLEKLLARFDRLWRRRDGGLPLLPVGATTGMLSGCGKGDERGTGEREHSNTEQSHGDAIL